MRADLIPTDFFGALARLLEEMSEANVEIGHILRFGAIATDPKTGIKYDNAEALLRELIDVEHAIQEVRKFWLKDDHAKFENKLRALFGSEK